MYVFLMTLHVILCLLLVLIILMQPGKGADVSSAFGGGAASQLFGASGPGNFLTRGTGAIAFLFMCTSIGLSLYSTRSARSGVDIGDDLQKVLDEGEEGAGFGDKKPVDAPAAPADAPVAPAGEPAVPGGQPAAPTGDPAAPSDPATPPAP